MKNNIIKRLIILCLALAVVLSGTTVSANIVLSKGSVTKYINTIAHRQMNEVKNPSHSSAGGEWTVMGLARAGRITSSYKNIYKNNLKSTLNKTNGILSTVNYTEYARTVIALTSIGENPYNFYGYDVISPLAEFDNVIKQGYNGVAYALIALNSGAYDVKPKEGYDGKIGTSDRYKDVLVSAAISTGGWKLFGKKADVDMTAIALQALAPYYKESKVKTVVDKGLYFLSSKQESSGGFSSMGNENCESSAQVLTAISTLKISVKDRRFVKNKNTVLDGLMKFYENGAFKHTEDTLVNQMSTDQAFYALVAYRNTLANDPPIFNMKKVAVKRKYRKPAKKKNHSKQINKETTANIAKNINQETSTKHKKKENEKSVNKNDATTVNIVEETTVNKKPKEDKASSWWWIGLIIMMIASPAVAYFMFRKRRD